MGAADVVRSFQEKRLGVLRGELKLFPKTQAYASDLDPADCLRKQVLDVVAWQHAAPPGPEAAEHFRAGREAERRVMNELDEMGIPVTRRQEPLELRHRRLGLKVVGGRLDGVVEIDGERFVAEVKLVRDYAYDQIRTEEDFADSVWRKKFPYQMALYLIGTGIERGLWIITDGRRTKPLPPVELNYELAEAAWAYAEQIWEAVVAYREAEPLGKKALPPFTTDTAQCLRCRHFKRSCHPEIPTGEAAEVIVSQEDIERIGRWHELKPDHKEYEALDNWKKARFKDGPALKVVGGFVVERTSRHRGEYTVPAGDYNVITVRKIGE